MIMAMATEESDFFLGVGGLFFIPKMECYDYQAS